MPEPGPDSVDPGTGTGSGAGTGPGTGPEEPEPQPRPEPVDPPDVAPPPLPGGADPKRRGFWYAIGDTPSNAELDAAPQRYGVVVLQPWETAAMRRIKAADPSVVVLMYQCLSSSRDNHVWDNLTPPSGVSWEEVQQNPHWLAKDTNGNPIEYRGYPGHFQLNVWDSGYQQRWVSNVTKKAVDGGWDGVLADNDIATLRGYSGAILSGTGSQDATDKKIRDGLDSLVKSAGKALNAKGKLLIPNIDPNEADPDRWARHSIYGGGMNESFVHWDQNWSGSFVTSDWGNWAPHTKTMGTPGLNLAITQGAAGDRRSLLFGYTSMLIHADSDAYWAPGITNWKYESPAYMPELDAAIGSATESGRKQSNGVWTRAFEGGWVAVNPSTSGASVQVPEGARDLSGAAVSGSVNLGPTSGIILITG